MIKIHVVEGKTVLSRRRQHRFKVVAANGKTLVWSEWQFNPADLFGTVDLLKRELPGAEIVYD